MQKQIFKQRKASGEEQNRFKRKKKKSSECGFIRNKHARLV